MASSYTTTTNWRKCATLGSFGCSAGAALKARARSWTCDPSRRVRARTPKWRSESEKEMNQRNVQLKQQGLEMSDNVNFFDRIIQGFIFSVKKFSETKTLINVSLFT
jgi:hypothetical protein